MNNKKVLARHFGRMSESYDEYANVQKYMAHSLHKFAEQSGEFVKILEIGCGTGFFTRLLADLYPQAQILATDISPEMLMTARSNLNSFSHVRFAVEDGEHLKTQEKFDLIISNAAFQWFNHYQHAFQNFYDRLVPGGCLLFATFGSNTFHELDASFKVAEQQLKINPLERHGPNFAAADTLYHIMSAIGFTAQYSEENWVEYFSSVREFLTAVKKVGANNAAESSRITINRRLILLMMEYYTQRYSFEQRIPATYHLIYGSGKK
ncbi:malonyl-ACP O-methyltransferase BioC [bacterium BFN5]|nr:malonyl-ACP O-methyltransferase BioC [bacterium BFN5]QJW45718.1 malonyl-ACP O-methyltransferase BioC [bacterium BFN5]